MSLVTGAQKPVTTKLSSVLAQPQSLCLCSSAVQAIQNPARGVVGNCFIGRSMAATQRLDRLRYTLLRIWSQQQINQSLGIKIFSDPVATAITPETNGRGTRSSTSTATTAKHHSSACLSAARTLATTVQSSTDPPPVHPSSNLESYGCPPLHFDQHRSEGWATD